MTQLASQGGGQLTERTLCLSTLKGVVRCACAGNKCWGEQTCHVLEREEFGQGRWGRAKAGCWEEDMEWGGRERSTEPERMWEDEDHVGRHGEELSPEAWLRLESAMSKGQPAAIYVGSNKPLLYPLRPNVFSKLCCTHNNFFSLGIHVWELRKG